MTTLPSSCAVCWPAPTTTDASVTVSMISRFSWYSWCAWATSSSVVASAIFLSRSSVISLCEVLTAERISAAVFSESWFKLSLFLSCLFSSSGVTGVISGIYSIISSACSGVIVVALSLNSFSINSSASISILILRVLKYPLIIPGTFSSGFGYDKISTSVKIAFFSVILSGSNLFKP